MLEYLVYGITALALLVVYLTHNRTGLPRIGKRGPLGFIQTAFKSLTSFNDLLDEGLTKFGGQPFVLPTLAGSLIVIGPENIDLIKGSDDSAINQPISVNDALQLDYTMNRFQQAHPYQAQVTRTDITRGIASFIPDVLDEARLAIPEALATHQSSLFHTMTHLVARISNRAMVGTDLCRNPQFIHDVVNFAETLVMYAMVLKWFPTAVRGMLYKALSWKYGGPKEAIRHIVPQLEVLLKEREQGLERPHHIIEYLTNSAPPNELANLELLAMRVLNLNFGSIHTSSIFGSHALFHLAALSEQDKESIRAEIIQAVESEGGWNKSSVAKMRKLDSTLREVGRVYALGSVGLGRLTIAPTYLADANKTILPPGYTIVVALSQVHYDQQIYPDPEKFDCFRFSKLREKEGSDVKWGFTTVENTFIPFGLGRHACPGRFFASMELKIMLAYVMLNYDISFPAGQTEPPKATRIASSVVPDTKASLIFTKREVVPGEDFYVCV